MIRFDNYQRDHRSSPLSYAAAGGRVERSRVLTQEEIEKAQKEELEAELRKKRHGTDEDDFLLNYAKIRKANSAHGVVVNAKALDDSKDEHILSNASSGKVQSKEAAEEMARIDSSQADPQVEGQLDALDPDQVADLAEQYDPATMDMLTLQDLARKLAELGLLTQEEADMVGFVPTPMGLGTVGKLEELGRDGKPVRVFYAFEGDMHGADSEKFQALRALWSMRQPMSMEKDASISDTLASYVDWSRQQIGLLSNSALYQTGAYAADCQSYITRLEEFANVHQKIFSLVSELQGDELDALIPPGGSISVEYTGLGFAADGTLGPVRMGFVATNSMEPIKCTAPDPTYPESIFGLSEAELEAALFGAAQACTYLDINGMSKAEIYNAYEALYRDYLGADFLEPLVLGTGDPAAYRAASDFWSVLKREGGVDIANEKEVLVEARGYTGMSNSEIQAAVRAQYPETMTLRQCLMMDHELANLGVGKGYGWEIKLHLFTTMGGNSPETQKVYDSMLDMPADYEGMKAAHDAFVANGRIISGPEDMKGVFKILAAWLGGNPADFLEDYGNLLELLEGMERNGEFSFDKYGACVPRSAA